MLALVKNNSTILSTHKPGSSFQVENGLFISNAQVGWSHNNYSLLEIDDNRTGDVFEVVGSLRVNGSIVEYDISTAGLADAKIIALKILANTRYAREIGGMVWNGMPTATDRDTQSKLVTVRILAKEDHNYAVKWKTGSGFVDLNATTIITLADAVRQHVQDCFDWEVVESVKIDAAESISALRTIKEGWES